MARARAELHTGAPDQAGSSDAAASATRARRSPRTFRASMSAAGRFLQQYYPLTTTGTVIFAAGIVFTALGNARGDVYQATLGVTALILTVLLAVLSRIQAGRFSDVPVRWNDPSDPVAKTFGGSHAPLLTVQAAGIRPWFFFRLHSRVTGVLLTGKKTRFHVFEEIATPVPEQISIPLAFPLPGTIPLRRSVQVRDVFGLTRGAFAAPVTRELEVAAPMPLEPQLTRMVAASGEQESTRTTTPEEERYYMREYIPGDRFRDINWKASSRIRELVTRISPQTQDEDRTITIYLRHFRETERESLEALAHLAYLKGWVIAFMRAVRREEHGVQFRVITAEGMHALQNDDEISQFSGRLCRQHFTPAPADLARDPAARMVIVFTTPFDTTLPAFTDSLSPVECQMFSTQFDGRHGNAGTHSSDRLNLTMSASALPVPPVRVLEPETEHTVSAPRGATLLEEVALTPVTERTHLAARS